LYFNREAKRLREIHGLEDISSASWKTGPRRRFNPFRLFVDITFTTILHKRRVMDICEVSDLLVRKEESYRPSTAIVMVWEMKRGVFNFFSSVSNRAQKKKRENLNEGKDDQQKKYQDF
jgi:hypothetical protein